IEYEWGRIARVCAAAVVAYIAAIAVPPLAWKIEPHRTIAWVPDAIMRGTLVVVVFTGLLALTGFLHPEEMVRLRALRGRGAPGRASTRPPDSTEMAGEIGATDIEPPQE
ncbi:MAG TPA: hypothetical protein VH138_00625, partial [Vicinamibacterales bacterium]|nr:hypothetical protein [Vicinamibacterales bacterium]